MTRFINLVFNYFFISDFKALFEPIKKYKLALNDLFTH